MDDLAIHRITAVERARIVREVTCQTDSQLRRLRNVDIHVGTKRIGLLVDVVVERVTLINLQDTRILGKAAGDIIPRNLAAASCRDVGPIGR